MSNKFRIGNRIVDLSVLNTLGASLHPEGIMIGDRMCIFNTHDKAKRAFNEIAAIMGAEDLCGDEEASVAAKIREKKEHDAEERWKPEVGEIYWTIDSSRLYSRSVGWDNDSYDRRQFDAGLVFRTQKEAEAALAKLMGPPPEATHEAQPELTVDDLAPRKVRTFDKKYWFVGDAFEHQVSWDDDYADNHRSAIGLVAQTCAEARAIADALAVIQEIKERSTCPPTVERCVAIDITDEEGHGLWSVSFGRFAHDIEADAVDAHIGEARLRNAANWVRGLPLLIENYGDDE